MNDIPVIKGNRMTYYVPMVAEGYTDYPFAPREVGVEMLAGKEIRSQA